MYVVFWGSSWNSSTGDPQGVQSRMLAFLGIIGGSGWLNSVTQYTQSGGAHVGNAAGSFVGSYVDTTSSPPSRPTQSQMAAEAAKAAANYGDYSSNAAYIVALPHGIKPSGFGTQYCAYHSSTTAAGHTIAWTNDPYLPDVGSSCGAGSVNSPGTLDGVSIVFGHEQGETETDPFPNSGWLDSSNAENGDKCAWTNLDQQPRRGRLPHAAAVEQRQQRLRPELLNLASRHGAQRTNEPAGIPAGSFFLPELRRRRARRTNRGRSRALPLRSRDDRARRRRVPRRPYARVPVRARPLRRARSRSRRRARATVGQPGGSGRVVSLAPASRAAGARAAPMKPAHACSTM